MQFWNLPLAFPPEQAASLRLEYAQLSESLEKHGALDAEHFNRLRAALIVALSNQASATPGFLQTLRDDRARHHLLHLHAVEAGDELLDLPWHIAVEDSPNVLVSKGLPRPGGGELPGFTPDLPLPLKVLVMVAAPDSDKSARLNYEAEENIILDALAPLMRSGEVEVNFTHDGSLESLQRSLAADRYHVLHFSGHSVFGAKNIGETPEAILLLEDEFSMNARPTSAADFAAVLNADPERMPALVLLSSCQSAQGGAEGGFRGAAQRLLQAGLPAVIAMGWSVTDFWATHFAGAFFKALAEHCTLGRAFNQALESGRKTFVLGLPAEFFYSQSLIPQLFLTKQVEHLVRWEGTKEKSLSRAGAGLLEGKSQLAAKLKKVNAVFGREVKDLLFIGRRRERKEALRQLREGRSVLLRGQGGMGKTALALHLALRQLVADPDGCVPLAFDQTTLSLENLCNALMDYLEVDARLRTIRSQVAALDKQWDKFFLLLETFEKQNVKPFFIFDNLETFQPEDDPGGPLRPEIAELLDYMLTRLGYPVLCTGRYPLREFDADTLHIVDMNEVPAGDFRQKCLFLPALRLLEVPGRSFDDIAATLHQSLGGNYRALEFFDELCCQAPDTAPDTLEALDRLLSERTGETLRAMSRDLVFENLLALLTLEERRALLLLAEFRRPVLPFALEYQDKTLPEPEWLLARAADLTLAERRAGEAEGRAYFFVPPLVGELLKVNQLQAKSFDDEQAGAYYEKVDKDLNKQNYGDLEEAFFHYERAGNVEKVNGTGAMLTDFYYVASQYQCSFEFARRTEALAGEQTFWRVLNRLGQLFQLQGTLDAALHFFERAKTDAFQRGEQKNLGTLLNNIGQIYDARGDYKTALDYLERSLKIRQEIGHGVGEGATLNNISQIYLLRGDYDRALDYLLQSLKIMQEVGDHWAGQGTVLNNISQFYSLKGDYDRALDYLAQSLKITQEIDDKVGLGVILNNLAITAHAKGDYDTALGYLQQSLKIRQEIGDRKGEGGTLNNISQIYQARGTYDIAFDYLQQSLKIQQDIGNRDGESSTLNNISLFYRAKGDYDTAFVYLQQSLKIGQEIGDISGMATTLTNMGAMLFEQNRLEEAVPMLLQAYQVFEKISSPNVRAPAGYLNAIKEKIGQVRYDEIVRAARG